MRGSSSATRRGVKPRGHQPAHAAVHGRVHAPGTTWSCGRAGPDAAGSSDTPWRVEKPLGVAEPLDHVGVAGQRPEAQLVVVVQRRLVAEAGVGRVRVLVDLVGVRVVRPAARRPTCRCSRPSSQDEIGDLRRAAPAGRRSDRCPVPAWTRAPEMASSSGPDTAGRCRRPSAATSRRCISAPMRSAQQLHVGVGGQHGDRAGRRRARARRPPAGRGRPAWRRLGRWRCAACRSPVAGRAARRRQNTSVTRCSREAKYV